MKSDDVSSRITRVEGQIESLTGLTTRLAHSTEILSDRIGQLGRPNISTMFSAAALILSAIAGLYAFTVLRIQTSIAPIESKVEVSIRDRQEIRDAFDRMQAQLNIVDARDQASTAKLDAATVEIESQFRASDQYHNVQQANALRYTALLWEKTYDQKFPEISYFPSIAQPSK